MDESDEVAEVRTAVGPEELRVHALRNATRFRELISLRTT
jgi:hypothetical protein